MIYILSLITCWHLCNEKQHSLTRWFKSADPVYHVAEFRCRKYASESHGLGRSICTHRPQSFPTISYWSHWLAWFYTLASLISSTLNTQETHCWAAVDVWMNPSLSLSLWDSSGKAPAVESGEGSTQCVSFIGSVHGLASALPVDLAVECCFWAQRDDVNVSSTL